MIQRYPHTLLKTGIGDNVIYLSNCLIKLKGGDKSREKIIDTCKIMR